MCHQHFRLRVQLELSTLSLLGERYLLLVVQHGSYCKQFEPILRSYNAQRYVQILGPCLLVMQMHYHICQLVLSGQLQGQLE